MEIRKLLSKKMQICAYSGLQMDLEYVRRLSRDESFSIYDCHEMKVSLHVKTICQKVANCKLICILIYIQSTK
jgi:hypothetical protein